MPGSGRSHKEEKDSWIDRVKDKISKREDPDDPSSRVGSGGRTRANKIDEYLEQANSGKKK